MDVQGFLRAVRKRWWAVLLLTVLGVAAAAGLTARQAKLYSSSVTFYVATPSLQSAGAYQASQYAQQHINTYVKLLQSDKLADLIVADTGLKTPAHSISKKISGSADINTVLLTATATDSSPSGALLLSRSISRVYGPMIQGLDTSTPGSAPSVVLTVTTGPTNPVQVAPHRTLNYGLGLLLGLALGLAFAALRQLLDTSIDTDEQLAEVTGTGVLGVISATETKGALPLIGGARSRSLLAEEIRQLRTNLQFVHVDRPVGVITVVSSTASEGKSTVATNLALSFAENHRNTLLIDADLRKPRIAEYLGIEGAVGLTDVLAGQVALEDALQVWGADGLSVLPSGFVPPNPAELLGSQQVADLIARLRGEYDMVVIDTPPLLPVTDGVVVTLLSDGAIHVVRNGKTSRAQVTAALRLLRIVDAPVLGAVRNLVSARDTDRSAYGDYLYYEEHEPEEDKPEKKADKSDEVRLTRAEKSADRRAEKHAKKRADKRVERLTERRREAEAALLTTAADVRLKRRNSLDKPRTARADTGSDPATRRRATSGTPRNGVPPQRDDVRSHRPALGRGLPAQRTTSEPGSSKPTVPDDLVLMDDHPDADEAQANGEHVNGEHVNGEHVNGEHVNGEQANGEQAKRAPANGRRMRGAGTTSDSATRGPVGTTDGAVTDGAVTDEVDADSSVQPADR